MEAPKSRAVGAGQDCRPFLAHVCSLLTEHRKQKNVSSPKRMRILVQQGPTSPGCGLGPNYLDLFRTCEARTLHSFHGITCCKVIRARALTLNPKPQLSHTVSRSKLKPQKLRAPSLSSINPHSMVAGRLKTHSRDT